MHRQIERFDKCLRDNAIVCRLESWRYRRIIVLRLVDMRFEKLEGKAVFVHLIPTICRKSFAPFLNENSQRSQVACAHAKLQHHGIKIVVSVGAQTQP